MAEPVSPARINFSWLVRLRFATIAGQAVTIAAVRLGMGVAIPLGRWWRSSRPRRCPTSAALLLARVRAPQNAWLLAVMAFDVLAFSALLYFTGGPENPFSFLYLVPIAIAAMTLQSAWTWALVLLSLASSAVLYVQHRPLPMTGDHAQHMALHLRGMWVAFGVAAAFIVHFLLRVRRALAHPRRGAGSLAQPGGAARPAGLAGHLGRGRRPRAGDAAVDHRRRRQGAGAADRACRAGSGRRPPHARGGRALPPDPVAHAHRGRRSLGRAVRAGVGPRPDVADCFPVGAPDPAVTLSVDADSAEAVAALPRHAFTQALRGLVDNARQASPAGAPVSVRVAADPERRGVVFEIADRGAGIPAAVLDRVGEPFFTTKPAGQGMGLGVFLARAIVERIGGELVIASAPGRGTTATRLAAARRGGAGDGARAPSCWSTTTRCSASAWRARCATAATPS